MPDKLDGREDLLAYLPKLTHLLSRYSVLIVLDNQKSLLRSVGESASREPNSPLTTAHSPLPKWRDERWGDVIDALLAHSGPSRLVLTSRVVPPVGVSEFAANLPDDRQRVALQSALLELPVHALSLDEAALLARQLPNLSRLLEGEHAADELQKDEHRRLVCRMLNLVQGHPKLMDLADRQAESPESLASHVERA